MTTRRCAFSRCELLFVGLLLCAGLSDMAAGAQDVDIFAKIWNMPESHVSVTKMGPDGKPLDPSAKVIVHEQGKAGKCLNEDNAPQPLLTVTDEAVFEEATFRTLIPLFDNYTAVEGQPEVTYADKGNEHWKEVDAFLEAVFATPTMQVAIEHIQQELSPGIALEKIRKDVRSMWFETYTNRYRNANEFCVGFEHVFIGEDESTPAGADPCRDAVAGYHSWVKFYHEKKQDKVDCLGYDYPEGNIEDALNDPKVTTVVMRWSPTKEEDRAHGHDLMKKPGGFFVGTKPELEIAFGTLAMYAQHARKYNNVAGKEGHHRVRLGENLFDIVMHAETLSPPKRGQRANRGWHIRTLYPKFRGRSIPAENGTAKVDLPTQPHNDAPIKVVAAMVNPDGDSDDGEWVQLENVTDDTDFNLENWSISDRSGRKKLLSGTLKAGESVKVLLRRENEQSMMLRNGGGWILLFQGGIRRAGLQYDGAVSGAVIRF